MTDLHRRYIQIVYHWLQMRSREITNDGCLGRIQHTNITFDFVIWNGFHYMVWYIHIRVIFHSQDRYWLSLHVVTVVSFFQSIVNFSKKILIKLRTESGGNVDKISFGKEESTKTTNGTWGRGDINKTLSIEFWLISWH